MRILQEENMQDDLTNILSSCRFLELKGEIIVKSDHFDNQSLDYTLNNVSRVKSCSKDIRTAKINEIQNYINKNTNIL